MTTPQSMLTTMTLVIASIGTRLQETDSFNGDGDQRLQMVSFWDHSLFIKLITSSEVTVSSRDYFHQVDSIRTLPCTWQVMTPELRTPATLRWELIPRFVSTFALSSVSFIVLVLIVLLNLSVLGARELKLARIAEIHRIKIVLKTRLSVHVLAILLRLEVVTFVPLNPDVNGAVKTIWVVAWRQANVQRAEALLILTEHAVPWVNALRHVKMEDNVFVLDANVQQVSLETIVLRHEIVWGSSTVLQQ